jgi:hypothetical protein
MSIQISRIILAMQWIVNDFSEVYDIPHGSFDRAQISSEIRRCESPRHRGKGYRNRTALPREKMIPRR